MTKLVSSLVKREDLSHEEFVEHWMDEHVPLASELPGLIHYETVVADDPEESTYDGVAILEFEDADAVWEALNSEQGKRTVADLDNFVKDIDRVVGENTVQVE